MGVRAPLFQRSEIFPQDARTWVLTEGRLGVLAVNLFPTQVSSVLESFLKAVVRHIRSENRTISSFAASSHLKP